MKRLTLIILGVLLCTPLYSDMNPYIAGAGVPVSGGGATGFVGTRDAVVDGEYETGQNTPHSHFVCPTSGLVSYVYVRRYDSMQDMALTVPGIWNADGSTLLASSANCAATNPSTNLYRYTLSSPITVTQGTTYTLGYATGDANFIPPYGGTGTIYLETGSVHTADQCPTVNSAVTHDVTYSTSGSLTIWASNDPSEE